MRTCPRCARPLPDTSAAAPLDAANAWTCPECGNAPSDSGGIPVLAPAVSDGFDPASFDMLAEAEERSFWFRQRNALITETLRRYAPEADSFLEIGCGNGYVLQAVRDQFPATAVAGAELHPEGLAYARARLPGVPLLQLDARALPFREEFAAIGAFDVIEHIDDDRAALASMHAALVPGGTLLVTVPQHQWLWSRADDAAHHQRRYSRPLLAGRLAEAGFEILTTTSFVTTLLPLMAASRILERRRTAPYDEMREHRSAERAGPLLERPLMAERALIRRGVRLPAGGSLLAVARRPA
jgi:SAM-dependent methyltransferase